MYKALLQGGHYNHTTGTIERVPTASWDSSVFANQFLKVVGREPTVSMCLGSGNGAFVVAELCEALVRAEAVDGRRTLKVWFTEELMKEIEGSEAKGKKVLLEKLALL